MAKIARLKLVDLGGMPSIPTLPFFRDVFAIHHVNIYIGVFKLDLRNRKWSPN